MKDNSIESIKNLLKIFNIKFTSEYIEESILTHQDYPSLLSISDTLNQYSIENITVKIDLKKLEQMPMPCIVQVKINIPKFVVLKKITNSKVLYIDDNNKVIEKSKEDFSKIWTGICLLAEASVYSEEVDIDKKLLSKNVVKNLKLIVGILLLYWLVISFINSGFNITLISSSFTIIYTFLKIVGLFIGILLLWLDVDQYNPKLQNFCTGSSQKINCNSVLNSKHAKLFKGTFSLSELSFSYFLGSFFFLLISNFSITSLSILGLISFASLPMIVISLYYQAFVIKQWCKLCITIQVVLVSEILVSYFGGFYKSNMQLETLPILLALLLIPILAWKLIKPLLEIEKETNLHKRGLKKIKNNPIVLDSLLKKSKKIVNSTADLGISITNNTAKYNVVKVCNPYCGPCAKAHPILEDLVNKGVINLQVLFTAQSNDDRMLKPVSHFLAIDSLGDKKKTQKALDDWYLAEKKDYISFAKKHPMIGELKIQNNKIEAMKIWCEAENITHTPTLFINGCKLPIEYTIEDLTDLLI